LGIPLHRADFSAEYRTRVFDRFLADYAAGRTPNPDVLCNREVKFQPFRTHALRLGADFIATGHYARLVDGRLLRAADANKDQTYFLAAVEPAQLQQVLFPVGELPKTEVRRLAQRAGLAVHRKRDSTGICFIGERPFREFLSAYLQPRPGAIEDEHGAEVGEHPGLMYFTLGQRQGLKIGGRRGARQAPWFVIGKDAARNVLIASQDAAHPRLFSRTLLTAPFHWIRRPESLAGEFASRIRHRQALQDCTVVARDGGRLEFSFAEPQRAATPGQYAVLYRGEECLGGGEIETTS
jgi:tRNA-specific 2-thiouridylase